MSSIPATTNFWLQFNSVGFDSKRSLPFCVSVSMPLISINLSKTNISQVVVAVVLVAVAVTVAVAVAVASAPIESEQSITTIEEKVAIIGRANLHLSDVEHKGERLWAASELPAHESGQNGASVGLDGRPHQLRRPFSRWIVDISWRGGRRHKDRQADRRTAKRLKTSAQK